MGGEGGEGATIVLDDNCNVSWVSLFVLRLLICYVGYVSRPVGGYCRKTSIHQSLIFRVHYLWITYCLAFSRSHVARGKLIVIIFRLADLSIGITIE